MSVCGTSCTSCTDLAVKVVKMYVRTWVIMVDAECTGGACTNIKRPWEPTIHDLCVDSVLTMAFISVTIGVKDS